MRSGLLVGPYDQTDRLTYWVRRIAKGGTVLAPAYQQVQFIDARDLAKWVVLMIEQGATGPTRDLEQILHECQNIVGHSNPIVWIDEEFLIEHHIQDWVELPLWLSTVRCMPGFSRICSQKAVQAGLHVRPLRETLSSILEWDVARGEPKLQAGLDAAKEARLLKQWEERQA